MLQPTALRGSASAQRRLTVDVSRKDWLMSESIRQALEKGDTNFEKLINRLLDAATFLKWPIRTAVIVIGILAISGIALHSLRSSLGGLALLVLFFLPEIVFLIVGNVHHRFVFPQRVNELDQSANSAFDELPASFCVFLRPFEFDGCYFVSIPTISPFGLLNGLTVDVEAHLSSMTRELRMPMVGLGGSPQQYFRAGRSGRTSTSNKEWKDRVTSALERSTAVFIIPAPNPGTLWELELIVSRSEIVNKTLFIMPPRPRRRPLIAMKRPEYAGFVEKYEMRWVETQTLVAQFGIALPDYTQEGAVFAFKDVHARPDVIAKLLPMSDEGTDQVIEFLIDKANPELLDELLGRSG